jgi:hypothetical protein
VLIGERGVKFRVDDLREVVGSAAEIEIKSAKNEVCNCLKNYQ